MFIASLLAILKEKDKSLIDGPNGPKLLWTTTESTAEIPVVLLRYNIRYKPFLVFMMFIAVC